MTIHSSSKHWDNDVRQAAEEVDRLFPRREWTSTYGGHGENSPVGAYAVDFMCNKADGDKIRDYLVKNRRRLGIRYIIWWRKIINWGLDGENAKWKWYFNAWNSNPSKNHTNHVHVSFEVGARYVPLTKPVTLYAAEPINGYTVEGKVRYTRPPGRALTGVVQTGNEGEKYLVTKYGTWYPLAKLSKAKPAKPKPPVVVKPAPVVKPPVVVKSPTGPTFTKVVHVDFPNAGNWQGVIPTKDHWYGVEARKQADGSEDCYIYRFPRKGLSVRPVGAPMQLNAAPGTGVHPTGWGVSETGVVWLTWNDEAEGNDVVTLQYQSGRTITKADCQEMHVFTDSNAQIAFDVNNEVAVVRQVGKVYDTHTLRTKQDILDNVDKPLGTVKVKRLDTRVVQGFTVVKNEGGNWELRVLTGLKSAGSPFQLERWSFVTSSTDPIQVIDLPESLGREPEGIDGDLLGFKTANRSGIDVYRYTI